MSNVDTRLCNVDVILNHIHTMETTCSLPRTASEHRAINVGAQEPSLLKGLMTNSWASIQPNPLRKEEFDIQVLRRPAMLGIVLAKFMKGPRCIFKVVGFAFPLIPCSERHHTQVRVLPV